MIIGGALGDFPETICLKYRFEGVLQIDEVSTGTIDRKNDNPGRSFIGKWYSQIGQIFLNSDKVSLSCPEFFADMSAWQAEWSQQ